MADTKSVANILMWILIALGLGTFSGGLIGITSGFYGLDTLLFFSGTFTVSCFSLAGFIAVYMAFLEQKRHTTEAQQQRFTSEYFNFLERYLGIIEDESYKKYDSPDCYVNILDNLRKKYSKYSNRKQISLLLRKKENIRNNVEPISDDNILFASEINVIKNLYPHFRGHREIKKPLSTLRDSIYKMIELVDQSTSDNKHYYIRHIQSQLTDQQIVLLYYEFAAIGTPDMKDLISRSGFFAGFDTKKLLNKSHYKLLNKSAFFDNYIEGESVNERLT